MSEIKSLQCGHCGGPVPLNDLDTPTPCPYCGHKLTVSERIRRALGPYGRSVGLGLRAIGTERGAVADQGASKAAQTRLTMPVLILTGITVVVMSNLVPRVFGKSSSLTTGLGWICALVMPIGLWVIARHRVRGSLGAPVTPPSTGIITCPECGAPHPLAAGGITDACNSCGASLLPSSALAVRGKATIEDMLLRERMSRWRADRAQWNYQQPRTDGQGVTDDQVRRSSANLFFLGFGGFISVMTLFSVAAGSKTTAGTVVAVMIPSCAALFVVEMVLDALKMIPRWHRSTDLLRTELGGERKSALEWLNSRWAGPFPDSIGELGRHHQVIMALVQDYPVMLYANTSDITLFLAAWTHGVSDVPEGHPFSSAWRDAPGVGEILAELAVSDFDVVIAPAGLIGFVRRNSMTKFRKSPEGLTALAPAIRRMADLAKAVGARPIPELRS